VAGGGVALLRARSALDALKLDEEERAGVTIVRRALEEPLRWIARNAGQDGAVVLEKVREAKGAFGFNAATEEYEDRKGWSASGGRRRPSSAPAQRASPRWLPSRAPCPAGLPKR